MLGGDDELLRQRMLPEASLTFTLPSIHDGTTLECRVFHPFSLSISPKAPPWQRNAAIVAHPYAPLGGCYDDPVVDVIASTLLRLGYLVCTFNFRGASGSAGRTSWTAKAERADYMSVAGFVIHYVHFLDPFQQAPIDAETRERPVLLFAGYSYGAMIVSHLPSLDAILASFTSPTCGSPAGEIRLRAEHMADTENGVLGSARAAALDRQNSKSPRRALAMRVGGDEQNRDSHDSPRRSFSLDAEEKFRDLIAKARKGHKRVASSESLGKKKPEGSATSSAPKDAPQRETKSHLEPIPLMTKLRPAYLLVSPLQGLITHLATMSLSNPFGKRGGRLASEGQSMAEPTSAGPRAHGESAASTAEAEQKLVTNPTLAIYGDKDVFVAAKKLRKWAERLQSLPDSQFRAHEISTAGHFWTEERVIYIMRDAVKTFAEGLLVL